MTEQLPRGWAWSTIGDVADVQLGRQRSPEHHSGDQMRPYLRSANVTWGGVALKDVKQMNFDDDDFEKYRLSSGDLLLNEASGSPNEVGKPAIYNGQPANCCFQNTLLRVRSDHVFSGYLYWFCFESALTGRFGEAGRGVNIRHLGKRGLSQFRLPVPPLAEQERIVTAIEEHLSRLDAAEASVRAASARVDRLLSASLHHAAEGPAVRLEELLVSANYGTSAKCAYDAQGPPVLRIPNLRRRRLELDDMKFARDASAVGESALVRDGDVLVIRTNGSQNLIGRTAVVREPQVDQAFASYLIRLVFDRGRIVPEFASMMLESPTLRRRIEQLAGSSAGQFNLSLSKIKAIEIPLPDVSAQVRLVRNFEASEEQARRIEIEVSQAQARSNRLRRSILSAAFSGQLVPQDLDDEPAEAMLERIAAERPTRTSRKKKS